MPVVMVQPGMTAAIRHGLDVLAVADPLDR
jgi:hypothetical protein